MTESRKDYTWSTVTGKTPDHEPISEKGTSNLGLWSLDSWMLDLLGKRKHEILIPNQTNLPIS